ncbi:MAG: transposase [Candidatus Njordarchaeia archaeon]
MKIVIEFEDKITNSFIVEKIREINYGKNLEKLECPYCGSRELIKYGKLDKQYTIYRYKCKSCGRTFNDLTLTPFGYSKLEPKELLIMFFLYMKMSLKISEIANILKRPYKTVWLILSKSAKDRGLFLENLFELMEYEVTVEI